MYDQFADDPQPGTGYRVMTFCARAGLMTWAIEEKMIDAITEAANLRRLGNHAEIRTRNYKQLSSTDIADAIASEGMNHVP